MCESVVIVKDGLIFGIMGFSLYFFLLLFSLNKLIDLLLGDLLDARKVIWWPFQNAKREAVHLQVHILHTTPLFGWLECCTL